MVTEARIIIGMPVHNDKEAMLAAVQSIVTSTSFPFTFIFIESESTDGAAEWLDRFAEEHPKYNSKVKVEVYHTKKEGPLIAYNRLFEIAKERQSDLYLVQTDVVHFQLYKRDWLYELWSTAQNEECGLIGPLGSWGKAHIEGVPEFDWIGGWACYVPIRTINLIGGYDERYEIGDFVDVDYCYNVTTKGLRLGVGQFWVQHHWMTAHVNEQRPQEELEGIKLRNRQRFKEKFNL